MSGLGDLAVAVDVGGFTVVDGRDVWASAVSEALWVTAVLDVSEVLGGNDGGRSGDEDDSETHFDWDLVG